MGYLQNTSMNTWPISHTGLKQELDASIMMLEIAINAIVILGEKIILEQASSMKAFLWANIALKCPCIGLPAIF